MEEMEGRGPGNGRSRLPASLFLSRTPRCPWKTGLRSEVRAKPMMLRKAQMEWAPAKIPALQPSFCVNVHPCLKPMQARQRVLQPENTHSRLTSCEVGRRVSVQYKDPAVLCLGIAAPRPLFQS